MGNNINCARCAKSQPPPTDDNNSNFFTSDNESATKPTSNKTSRRQQNTNNNIRSSSELKSGRKGVRGSTDIEFHPTSTNHDDFNGDGDPTLAPVTPKFFSKTAEQQQFLEKCFASNFLSHIVNETDEVAQVIYAMECQRIDAGTTIINQNDVGDYFYIIEDGVVSFEVDGMRVGGAMAGDCFGETALLFDCPRQATVVADKDVVVWRLDQKTFRFMLAQNAKKEMESVVDVLKTVPFLVNLNLSELVRIADAMIVKNFKEGERIFDKGVEGDLFYIIKEGMVKIHDIGHGDSDYVDQILKAGSFFGEKALMTDEPRAANASAVTNGTALCLKREDFRRLFGNVAELIESAARRNILVSSPVFAKARLSLEQINKLMNLMERQTFFQSFQVGMHDRGFFIIEEGEVRIRIEKDGEESATTNNNSDDMDHSRRLGKGDHFGGVADNIMTVELLSTTICCHVLTNENIQLAIGDDKKTQRLLRASVLLDNVTLDSFTNHGVIGVGAYGSVSLVSLGGESQLPDSSSSEQSFFAMKQLSKRHLIDSKSVKQIFREREILTIVNHPLVVKIHTAFQSPSDLYIVTSFLPGGELFDIIYASANFSGLSIDASVFYSACTLEALSYLHSCCSVLYRDVKPENIMIDHKGYGNLIDFGFAKIVTGEKTFTLCGTPECMAPEVILSKGHGKGCDYWSLGVLIFEMLAGYTPFAAKGISELVLFKRVIKGKFYLPKKPTFTDVGKDLIKKLLEKKPSRRLGCLAGGGDDVKNHEFFESIDWFELYEGNIAAPFVPSCDLQAFIKEIQENPREVDIPLGGELLEGEDEEFVGF